MRRSKSGGTLFHAESGAGASAAWFTVGVFREQVAVQWRLGGAPLPALRRMRAQQPRHWTTLRFSLAAGQLRGTRRRLCDPPPQTSPIAASVHRRIHRAQRARGGGPHGGAGGARLAGAGDGGPHPPGRHRPLRRRYHHRRHCTSHHHGN